MQKLSEMQKERVRAQADLEAERSKKEEAMAAAEEVKWRVFLNRAAGGGAWAL